MVTRLTRVVATTWLSMLLVYMGALPTLALCVGENHVGHVVVALAPDHCATEATHTHDDDDHDHGDCFCAPDRGCPGACTDLLLTHAAEPPQREDAVGPILAESAVAVGARVSDYRTVRQFVEEGPRAPPIPLAGLTCRLII